MRTNLVLTVASVMVMLAWANPANAQSVTITKTNYVAPKANPEGTATIPAGTYRVKVGYGKLAADNKTFTPDAMGIGAGYTFYLPLAKMATTLNWGPDANAETLTNPLPAMSAARAQLMKFDSGNWVPYPGVNPAYFRLN